jgi:hypothetical protein
MTTGAIDIALLPYAWPLLWPMIEPALLRSPGEEKPDVRSLVISGHAQLWAIIEDNKTAVAAVVTEITTEPERRCRLWLVGGRRLREWAADFMASIEPWARAWGCKAIYGTSTRRGWARIVKALGGEQIDYIDEDDLVVWQRRL